MFSPLPVLLLMAVLLTFVMWMASKVSPSTATIFRHKTMQIVIAVVLVTMLACMAVEGYKLNLEVDLNLQQRRRLWLKDVGSRACVRA